MILTPTVINRIIGILKNGNTVELKLEHHRLVIVEIRRKAEKTEIEIA